MSRPFPGKISGKDRNIQIFYSFLLHKEVTILPNRDSLLSCFYLAFLFRIHK